MRYKIGETDTFKKAKSDMDRIEKTKRKDFVKLVNQLMLKMRASLIVKGSYGYERWTDFDKKITEEIFENEDYKTNVESEINEDNVTTIGMMVGNYGKNYDDDEEYEWLNEDYLDIEYLDNGFVRLIKRNRDYDESRENEEIQKDTANAIIKIEELQKICDSLPGLYPNLAEEMIEQNRFFDDNGRFSKNEIREFMRQKYIPGHFFDVYIGAGSGNYGEVTVSIPNGIATEITADMFEKYKEKLVEVSIPSSVTSIEKETFSNCPNLKKVLICEKTGIQDVFELFENCPNLDKIWVIPQEAEQYYDRHSGSYYTGSRYTDENGITHELKEVKKELHTIEEIADTVSDRKLEDINKVVAEISEEMKDKSKENEPTKGN